VLFRSPGDLLAKVDITSMANSLEVRAPFLDHDLVRVALTIPTRLKREGVRGKRILRATFADLVPPALLRRRKMGFAVPISRWFRGELADYLRSTLLAPDARIRRHFRPEALDLLVTEHLDSRADHASKLYALLALELWHREFLP
jgi:asparagine synthase (glutamine-hydrolysing)